MHMKFKHNPRLVPAARELRKNMTPQEKYLWYNFLRGLPVRFLRQKIIDHYIADFYCAKAKLVIEIDGSQHYTEEGFANDEYRTKIMNAYGLSVIRFKNDEIENNFQQVCKTIKEEVQKRVFPDTPRPP